MQVLVANRVVDLVAEGVDLALRAARLADSTLVARKFMAFSGGLWASAAYLRRRGTPKTPAELAQHDFLRFSTKPLELGDGRSRAAVPDGRLAVDDLETLWTRGALSFVYPGHRFVPANVRAFIDTALASRDGAG